MINIRAKHGPHSVVFSQEWGERFVQVMIYARESLNATYGLKLTDTEGVTLELLYPLDWPAA